MKTVILAGGLGTRLAEETELKPKPMVEVGGLPILWHIMKIYAQFQFDEFYIALGYKGEYIKRFFYDYHLLNGDISFNFAKREIDNHRRDCEDWKVHLIDTGETSMTGGRIKRLEKYLEDEPFMVTYGDGVGDVDIVKLVEFHKSHGKLGTVTAVHPSARFGELLINEDCSTEFSEKPQTRAGWVNGGFLVLEPEVLEYLSGDESILEIDLLERLADEKQLVAFRHDGFWQCMDTLRDKRHLERLWQEGNPPWKSW